MSHRKPIDWSAILLFFGLSIPYYAGKAIAYAHEASEGKAQIIGLAVMIATAIVVFFLKPKSTKNSN